MNHQTKRCTKCQEEKPLAAFYTGKGPFGCRPRCKDCMRVDEQISRAQRAERQAKTQAANALHAKGQRRCTKCGQTKPLSAFGKHRNGRRHECRQCVSVNPANYRSRTESKNRAAAERAAIAARKERRAKARADREEAKAARRTSRVCKAKPSHPLPNYRGTFTPNRHRIKGATAYIELTNRQNETIAEAIIDAADLPTVLARGRWNTAPRNHTTYTERSYRKNDKAHIERLHRFLMKPPADKAVDHINGDGLDNRRENLRIVTQAENMQNTKYHRAKRAN